MMYRQHPINVIDILLEIPQDASAKVGIFAILQALDQSEENLARSIQRSEYLFRCVSIRGSVRRSVGWLVRNAFF